MRIQKVKHRCIHNADVFGGQTFVGSILLDPRARNEPDVGPSARSPLMLEVSISLSLQFQSGLVHLRFEPRSVKES
jgi:hypothetical protein